MLNRFRTDRYERRMRREPPKKRRLIQIAKPEQPMAPDLLGQIAMLQSRADHLNIRFKDAENRLAARPFK